MIKRKKDKLDDILYSQAISPNRISEKEKKAFDARIELMEEEIQHLEDNLHTLETLKRNNLKEAIVFVDMISKAVKKRSKASYVQKAKIASILCSNIEITAQKQVIIYIKEVFKPLFKDNLSPYRAISNIHTQFFPQCNVSAVLSICGFVEMIIEQKKAERKRSRKV